MYSRKAMHHYALFASIASLFIFVSKDLKIVFENTELVDNFLLIKPCKRAMVFDGTLYRICYCGGPT